MLISVKMIDPNGNATRKQYTFNTSIKDLKKGERVLVDTQFGEQVAIVCKYVKNQTATKNVIKRLSIIEAEIIIEFIEKRNLKKLFDKYQFDEANFKGINYNVPTENGYNTKLKAHIKSEEEMYKLGFTNHHEPVWYFSKRIESMPNISFNVSIYKETQKIKIDVLDENFLQPYNYQRMLADDPTFKYAMITHAQVQYWMNYLLENRIISGYIENDYI